MGLYVGPFGIAKVGLVCSSHGWYSTELLPQYYFSDSIRVNSRFVLDVVGNSHPRFSWGAPTPRRLLREDSHRLLSVAASAAVTTFHASSAHRAHQHGRAKERRPGPISGPASLLA